MVSLTVRLTDPQEKFIEEQIRSGGYPDAGGVVRAAVELLRSRADRQARKFDRLQAAVAEGVVELDRGEGAPIEDLEGWFDKLDAEAGRS